LCDAGGGAAGNSSGSSTASVVHQDPEIGNMSNETPPIEHEETVTQAIMTYRKVGDRHIEVNHTRVAREAQGQGLAGKLYRAMVEHARSNGLKVTPTCSYVVRMFERFPEDRDLLKD
jgi:predicted GNAT family acetyltransferase